MNRRKTRTLPGGQVESYNYDATGNATGKTTFNGNHLSYSYDPQTDRLTSESGPGFNYGYQYDASGYRVVMNDLSGATTFNHDERDRLTAKKGPFGTLTYGYDDHGNLVSVTSSNANGTNVGYQYDADNRLVTVTDTHRGIQTTSYGYDNVGNLAGETLPNGASVTYQYDTLNRLTSMAATVSGSPIASYAYTLGNAGNRLTVSELSNRNVQYTYDNLYRLTSETIQSDPASNNGTIGYGYDPVGNRQSRTSTVAPIPGQSFSGAYDSNDRLTAGFTYDNDGNTLTQGVTQYGYDGLDHLTQVTAPGLTESFTYDGDGNKVGQTVNGTTTNYLIDNTNLTGYAQVLEELQGGTVDKVYTYGLNRISEDQFNGTSWNLSFYGYDGQGSVRYLTDPTGAITDSYTYDAFGNLISQTGTTPNVYLYDGEQSDSDLGEYYLRARFMNEGIGRFQTMDTYEGDFSDPRSLNKYLFTADEPINKIDPSGNDYGPRISELLRFGADPLPKGNVKQYLAKYPTEIYIPPDVDLDQNIESSFTMNLGTWFWKVFPGGAWDYKAKYGFNSVNGKQVKNSNFQKLANLGNFNYGATGKAEGISDDLLLRGAGAAEIGKYILTLDPGGYITGQGQGFPTRGAPYGDAPRDQLWIEQGITYFNLYYASQ